MPEEPNNTEQPPLTPQEPEDSAATAGEAGTDETAAETHVGGPAANAESVERPDGVSSEEPAADTEAVVSEPPAGSDATSAESPNTSGSSNTSSDQPESQADAALDDSASADDGAARTPEPAQPSEREGMPATTPVGQNGETQVTSDEVEAAMQEMLAAAEQGEEDGTPVDAAASNAISAGEIEAAMQEMLAKVGQPATDGASGVPPTTAGDLAAAANEQNAAAETLDSIAQQSESNAEMPAELPPDTTPFDAPDFSQAAPVTDASQIDLLDDVELDVRIELGRADMYIEDVLGLGAGSVVELDKAAGDPVDILVNDRLVARGEVLVLNDNFCVRINDIISPIPELESER